MFKPDIINFTASINKNDGNSNHIGSVFLVGAGPGDPDLLTVKALRIIQSSDIIFYDQLISDEIKQLFPISTQAIYVGKIKNKHSIAQQDLNELLVQKAQQGLNICRLKGGDPFVFGRGGEEMLKLKASGIPVEIIPGITSASGASSYAGIPLTHRGISQGCTFITAHTEKQPDINWQHLAKLNHTLVFYMGVSKANVISHQLINAGLSKTTPTAIIENGCRQQQRVITGQLKNLGQLITANNINSPALIVVGDVVNLSAALQWFKPNNQISNKQLSA